MRGLIAALGLVGLAACQTALPASDLAVPAREVIVPEPWQETYDSFHYAPAVRAGDMVYLSGVVASTPPGIDMETAFDGVFRNIAEILNAAGADWNDVVDIQSFHTDLPGQADAFIAVKDRWVLAPYPAWTAIDVDRLYPDDGIAEVRVVAYAPR